MGAEPEDTVVWEATLNAGDADRWFRDKFDEVEADIGVDAAAEFAESEVDREWPDSFVDTIGCTG